MNAYDELSRRFAEDHPDRVAALVETADSRDFAEFLESLDAASAARVVNHASPGAAARALAAMQPEAASRCLRELNPRSAAALLRRVPPSERTAALDALPVKLRQQLVELLQYEPHQAGSRIDTRVPAVNKDSTVSHVLELVKQAHGGAMHYVYVVDEAHKLVGVVTMRELLCAAPEQLVSEIMLESPIHLLADDPVDAVVVHPGWRKVHALPVVDPSGRYLGAIRYSEFRLLEAEAGRSLGGPSKGQTSTALAELFWLGASAMVHLGEAAVLGRTRSAKESGA